VDADDEETVNWFEPIIQVPLDTIRVAISARGRHYYFRIPPNEVIKGANIRTLLGHAGEIRGEGTITCMPPSVHQSGHVYEWLHAPPFDDIPAISPQFIYDQLPETEITSPSKSKKKSKGSPSGGSPGIAAPFQLGPGPLPKGEASADGTADGAADGAANGLGPGKILQFTGRKVNFESAVEGERNQQLYREICYLADPKNMTSEGLANMALRLNISTADPLPETEVRATAKSAFKFFPRGGDAASTCDDFDRNGTDFLTPESLLGDPEPFHWIFDNSFLRGQLGMIFGPPGSGKGLFTSQLILALASGNPLFENWFPTRPFRVMSVSVEDTSQIQHFRLKEAMEMFPDLDIDRLDFRAHTFRGDVALAFVEAGRVAPAPNYAKLDIMLMDYKPNILILDTFVRFLGGDENNNVLMNGMLALLEATAERHNCNIVLIHHSNKSAGDVIHVRKNLLEAMSQVSIRGASSIAGALRWVAQLVPISGKLAGKFLKREEALEGEDGCYVAAKVVKKNMGSPERMIILEKSDGVLKRLYQEDDPKKLIRMEESCRKLPEELRALAANGEKIFPKHLHEALGWPDRYTRQVVAKCLERGTIEKIMNPDKARTFFLRAVDRED
jgi:hypothetical protein